ncbi:MAG: cyclic nucleotide-binding domain-containing protein [Magnetococcus sp. YQC-5]
MNNDLIVFLNKIPFFKAFTDAEKKRLLEMPHFFSKYAAGEHLIRENRKEDYALFVMLKGSARVTKNANPDVVLDQMVPGCVFGEISFLIQKPRTTNVIANEEVFCFIVKNNDVDELPLHLQIKIKDCLIELLVKRLDRVNNLAL